LLKLGELLLQGVDFSSILDVAGIQPLAGLAVLRSVTEVELTSVWAEA